MCGSRWARPRSLARSGATVRQQPWLSVFYWGGLGRRHLWRCQRGVAGRRGSGCASRSCEVVCVDWRLGLSAGNGSTVRVYECRHSGWRRNGGWTRSPGRREGSGSSTASGLRARPGSQAAFGGRVPGSGSDRLTRLGADVGKATANGSGRSAWGALERATGRAARPAISQYSHRSGSGSGCEALLRGAGAKTYPVNAQRLAARLVGRSAEQQRGRAEAGARGGGLVEGCCVLRADALARGVLTDWR
jgi:hypothetical protein